MKLANAIARLRGKQARRAGWTPEPEHDDDWTRIKRGHGAQRKGRIYAALRNEHYPVDPSHQNRAGHREYARLNQTRQGRRNIVGFGKWRRHRESTEESWASQSAGPPRQGDRRDFRRITIEADKASRRARGRRVTPVR